MSAAIFCCSSVSPYRPRTLDHEAKFTSFTRWAHLQKSSPPLDDDSASIVNSAPYSVQLVRQINYGPQESIRYFVPTSDGANFAEVTEEDLIKSNFEKLNSYKNFRCETHNRFFEVNLYQKGPTNAHHWRSNLARPSRDIDLAFRQRKAETDESGAQLEKKHDPESIDHIPKHCRRKDDTPEQNRTGVNVGGFCEVESEKDDKGPWWADDDDHSPGYDDDYSDHGAAKDYTACDKECGYCGTCDY